MWLHVWLHYISELNYTLQIVITNSMGFLSTENRDWYFENKIKLLNFIIHHHYHHYHDHDCDDWVLSMSHTVRFITGRCINAGLQMLDPWLPNIFFDIIRSLVFDKFDKYFALPWYHHHRFVIYRWVGFETWKCKVICIKATLGLKKSTHHICVLRCIFVWQEQGYLCSLFELLQMALWC